MVDPVGEPDPLQIGFKGLPVLRGLIPFKTGVYPFQGLADLQVVAVVLVPDDVPACQPGLGELIDEFLFIRGEGF